MKQTIFGKFLENEVKNSPKNIGNVTILSDLRMHFIKKTQKVSKMMGPSSHFWIQLGVFGVVDS